MLCESTIVNFSAIVNKSLNPSFNGICSVSVNLSSIINKTADVLILLLMEYAL